ncbi:hypothetical protein [Clostridium acetireducens]|uniref:hypothetical protein n=1 Tax=Clostridium acetireducens TaxID=76489 RepID=UPI000872AC30|nr:hypothetical protein [Clostridium acetireducens]
MKKISYLVIVPVFILMIFAFKNIKLSFTPKIVPRKIINVPLEGNWIVEKYTFINDSSITKEEAKNYIGEKAHFDKNTVYFNKEICKEPNFKVKIVNSKSYFWDKFKIKDSSIGIKNEYMKVITISSKEDKFFDEYIQIDKNYVIKNQEGLLLFFKREGSQGKLKLNLKEKDSKIIISNIEKEIKYKSGVLLGLRFNDEEYKYNYRTLWISYNYGKFDKLKEIENILVPRKNGFFKVGVQDNVLWAEDFNSCKKINENHKYKNSRDLGCGKIIFIGNEYISIDKVLDFQESYLRVFPLDNLQGEGLNIHSVSNSLSNIFNSYEEKYKTAVNKKDMCKNWAVVRRSGRWILRGRVNFNDSKMDYDISYAPPKKIVNYDELYPSFNVIKSKVPLATDAYTSPNRDFIIIFTKTNLMVAHLKNGVIGDIAINVNLKEGEEPIMCQWATGTYVDSWTKQVEAK